MKKESTINTILLKEDSSCEMAVVSVNGKCIMEGNYWDFHNGCHGINEYGEFNSRAELIQRLYLHLVKTQPTKKIVILKQKYKYGD